MQPVQAEVVRPRRPRARPALAAVVTLAVFLTATAVAWTSITEAAHQDAVVEFEQSADQASVAVQGQIEQYTDRLRDIGTFAETAGGASPATFSSYVRGTRVFDRFPSVVGVFYLSRVPEAEMAAFVEETRRNDPDFAVFEIAPERIGDIRYLLTYYAPGRVDLGLPIGTDVSPISAVTKMMTVSASSGHGIAGSFQEDPFLQDIADRTDFAMIDALLDLDFFIGVPIYAPGTDVLGPPSVPVGWIAATIADFDEVATEATIAVPADVGMALTVELDGTGLADRSDLSRVAEVDGGAGPRREAAFETSRSIQVEGIVWRLDVWSSATADVLPASARVALAAGIAGSALAAGLVYARLRARDRERVYASDTAERERFQREILDSVTNAMVVLDDDGRIARANPAWHELWVDAWIDPVPDDRRSWVGFDYLDVMRSRTSSGSDQLDAALTGVLGRSLETTDVDLAITVRDLSLRDEGRRVAGADASSSPPAAEPGNTMVTTERWLTARVTPLRGQRPGAIVIHTDITEQKRSHDRLEEQAARDNLTGLANRTTFERRVATALTPARHGNDRVAVLFIDLDGFKPVNDTYGHAVGDDVLRTVGRRIESVVRASDTAARLGGDEFVVLIDPLPDRAVAEATAERILSALSTPIRSDDLVLSLAASIGVAVIQGPTTESAESLIERADAAMYVSKQQGGARTTITGD